MMNTAICSIMDNHIAIGIFIINNVQKYIEYNNIMLGGPLKIIYSFLVLYRIKKIKMNKKLINIVIFKL